MNKEPKFKDGEKVILNGQIATINEWSYIGNLRRFAYTIVESPASFYYENELRKIGDLPQAPKIDVGNRFA